LVTTCLDPARRRLRALPWLLVPAAAAIAAFAVPATTGADVPVAPDSPILRALPRVPAAGPRGFTTANANCPDVTCDTVWVGHSSAGPGGAYLGVGVGGVWDFDSGVAGTDTTQGWAFHALPIRFNATASLANRLYWARDYGNSINEGDQALWDARALAGRSFVKTGVAGAWHADGMAGVKRNVNDALEPSATPIAGARSAWCGLRESGNTNPDGLDALTGNYLTGDLAIEFGGYGALPEFPGFCNLWDQMLYKDFAGSTGAGTVSFRVRTDMSNVVDPISNGSGWLSPFPDPELVANFVNHPADSLMVYVGSPTEVAYDTNRRWFSEVLDLSKPYVEIFSAGGVFPSVAPDSAIARSYAGLEAGTIRVVFRVKTNRVRSDLTTGTVEGYNSKQGAALIDEVSVDGGATEGFETTAQVKARTLIPDLSAPGGPWATTGRPPHQYDHVEDVLASGLAYDDLCGGIGTPGRICNLTGSVLVAGNHGDPNHVLPMGPSPPTENYYFAESPTIDLAVRSAAPGTKNGQGIDQETAARTSVVLQYDFYSGSMGLDESVFYRFGLRAHGPQLVQPISYRRVWSGPLLNQGLYFNPDPLCYQDLWSYGGLGVTPGTIDSLRIVAAVITQGYRFGGINLGNTQGTYWDNLRVGFVRASAPALAGTIWHQLQDQFPWNEGVPPGDNAGFDTTAALMNSGLNIVAPEEDPGVVAGDSIVYAAPYEGDGVASGTRLDLVFRIDPGPGNYVVKGNRASALVNRDPAHPFFAAYLADNGTFGTHGGHGGTWNRHVWNSARMDSAEMNLYPIVSRGLGNPVSPGWMSTLHEADPRFATLGIQRNVCFLVNPAGPADDSNIDCPGAPPAAYGPVSGVTKEGTKILPDGWFTPGTHIEYFVRRSSLEAPGTATLLLDTTRVFPQDLAGLADLDADRWHSVDVLPDMWKSARFGGGGLACMLVIDGADHRGPERAWLGAMDTLCYGKNNGAKKGWKGLGPQSDPNDPAGYVPANLGQAGLNFDLYEIRAAESAEAGHPGVRLATNLGAIAGKGDRSGPSPTMLGALYSSLLVFTGDLDNSTLHDAFDQQEGADDIALYDNWLAGATPANRRGLWLSGDGIMEDATLNSDDGTVLLPFLFNRFGAELQSENYKVYSGSPATTVGFIPLAAWAHPGRIYGLEHLCTVAADVLLVESTVAGAIAAARYQSLGPGSEFTSSVYRPVGTGREFRTLLDGFDVSHLRGSYANLGQIPTLPATDQGRFGWIDDALLAHFQICSRRCSWIGVGDLPGIEPARFANLNLGALPNPAMAVRTITLRFTLARPGPVTIRVFNVAGREVARLEHEGTVGRNDVPWDGTLEGGVQAAAGVYFYRIDGIEFGPGSSPNKMILLGAATR
jgi:hypothetical protein